MRLAHPFLLALRAVALLLLACAFAWPYIRSQETTIPAESRVYIFDNTLSVQADAGFERQRNSLLHQLRRAAPNVQIGVVELRANPAVIVPFTASHEVALATVQALTPTHQRGSYSAAFRTAASLLASSPASRKRLIFLGDNQANQWHETVGLSPFLNGTSVDIPPVTGSNLPNTCVSVERLRRLYVGDQSRVNLTLRIARSGPPTNGTLVVHSGSKTVLQQDVALGPDPAIVNCEWDENPLQPLLGEAVVHAVPDALAADDRAYFALDPLFEGKVALLASSVYLKVALSPTVMRGHWSTEVLDSAHLPNRPTADVLCIESEFLPAASKLAQAYLASGRGILLFVNTLSPAVKGALLELGFESDKTDSAPNAEGESIQVLAPEHPIFRPFENPDFGNLSEIKVFSYAHLSCRTATPLACSQSGTPLLFERKSSSSETRSDIAQEPAVTATPSAGGKLLLVAFAIERTQTLWPVHPTFVPFLDLCLQETANKNVSPLQSCNPGETMSLTLGQLGAKRFTLTQAESSTPLLSGAVHDQHAEFIVPDEPGVYRISFEPPLAEIRPRFFAVNSSPKESELIYTNGNRILQQWQQQKRHPMSDPTAVAPVMLSSIFTQRFWWWLLAGCLVLLFFETITADRLHRRTS